MRTIGIVGIGFEPSALPFEVIGLKGDKTACQVLVDLYNLLQRAEYMLRAVHIGFNDSTVIKRNGLRQSEHRLNIAGNAVGHVLPAHAAITE